MTKDTPPTFLWATAADELVPVQYSLLMATALADAGVPFELHVFEKGKHGMGLANQASAEALTDCNADAAGWAVFTLRCWIRPGLRLPKETLKMMAPCCFRGFRLDRTRCVRQRR